VYAVERQGAVLPANQAVRALDVLDTQELAIILRQIVATSAESEYNLACRPDSSMRF